MASRVAPAPDAGTRKVTAAPTTGLLLASSRRATSGAPKAVLTGVLSGVPDSATKVRGVMSRLDSVNAALGTLPLLGVTKTLYVPSAESAVALTVAYPEASVVALPALNVAEAPVAGSTNDRVRLGTGLPYISSA